MYSRGSHSRACALLEVCVAMAWCKAGTGEQNGCVLHRCPSVEATAVASIVLSAALEVCRERSSDHLPGAAAIQIALQAQLMYLNTGAAHCLIAAS